MSQDNNRPTVLATRAFVTNVRRESAYLMGEVDEIGADAVRAALEEAIRALQGRLTFVARATGTAPSPLADGDPNVAALLASVPTPYIAHLAPASQRALAVVAQHVARHFEMDPVLLWADRMDDAIVFPRMVAMYFGLVLTTVPSTKVANFFGKSDHTTALYAKRNVPLKIRAGHRSLDGVSFEQLARTIARALSALATITAVNGTAVSEALTQIGRSA